MYYYFKMVYENYWPTVTKLKFFRKVITTFQMTVLFILITFEELIFWKFFISFTFTFFCLAQIYCKEYCKLKLPQFFLFFSIFFLLVFRFSILPNSEETNYQTENVLYNYIMIDLRKIWKLGIFQPEFTCSKLTVETLTQGVKYVQS